MMLLHVRMRCVGAMGTPRECTGLVYGPHLALLSGELGLQGAGLDARLLLCDDLDVPQLGEGGV